MISRSFLALSASAALFGAACSSTTTGGYYTDGGTDARRDGAPILGGGDSGGRFDTGVVRDTGGTVKDTGTVVTDTKPPPMTCESCQSTYCATEASACSAETACTDTLDCIQACPTTDMSCPQNCVDTKGSTKFMPWYTCLYDNCQDSCFE